MKFATYTYQSRTVTGAIIDDRIYTTSSADSMLYMIRRGITPTRTYEYLPLADVKLEAPLCPGKLICIGRNYAEHAKETGSDVPAAPIIFAKFPSSIIGNSDTITWSESITTQVDWEGELAVVIGKKARNVNEEDALKHVFGYTIANDVSARDWQNKWGGSQWCRGKTFATFCPLGPCLVTTDEIPNPNALAIRTVLNGQVMQDWNTNDMIFDVPTLIEFLSGSTVLLPGTVILTGTPHGVGAARKPPIFLKPGDSVSIEIEKIGTLTNPVIEETLAG